MDIENIITLAGVALGGGGIVKLLDWRAERRKAR